MKNLLVINRFIPKAATRLTAGLASTAIATLFMYLFFSNQSDRFFGMERAIALFGMERSIAFFTNRPIDRY